LAFLREKESFGHEDRFVNERDHIGGADTIATAGFARHVSIIGRGASSRRAEQQGLKAGTPKRVHSHQHNTE
jgi:hypothetical protein